MTEDEYKKLEEAFIREQYKIDKPLPNQMVGTYGWYAKKKQEFREKMNA